MTSALELDDARARLAVAQADASKAIGEASQLGRLLINDMLRDEFTPARLASMREQLQVLRHALHDLEEVHADLRRRAEATVVGSTRHEGDPAPADEPSPTTGPCRQCRRDDALVALPYVVFAQYLALFTSLEHGKTPDNPFPSGEVNRVVQGVTIYPMTNGG